MKWQLSLWILFIMAACSPLGETKTSRDAGRAEVRFILLPESASEISFWDSGNNKMTTFKVPELDFTQMFPDTIFAEISATEDCYYYDNVYGDLHNPPHLKGRDSIARKGLYFRTIKSNGGGTELIYDREKNTAFVLFAGW